MRSVARMNAAIFAALGEPHRLQIVELLREQPRSVGEITQALKLRQPQASKHLRQLREVGIVSVEAVARRRIYHLNTEPFAALGSWVDSFEREWEQRLDALGTFLSSTARISHDP